MVCGAFVDRGVRTYAKPRRLVERMIKQEEQAYVNERLYVKSTECCRFAEAARASGRTAWLSYSTVL